MRCIALQAAALLVVAAPAPVLAQLAVDRLWVDFEPGAEARADVVIRNESSDRYYIVVSPAEVVDPGGPNEKRVENSDPEKLGLLVTPNRLVIDPGGVRSLRIVSLNSDIQADRVYRIKVTPQVGDIQAANAGAGNHGVAIKILAAYDLLVTVRPKKGKAELVASRTASDIVIRNKGNTNTLLFEGEACLAGGPQSDPGVSTCEPIAARRMYPGNEWTIPLKSNDARVRFKERAASSADPKEVTF